MFSILPFITQILYHLIQLEYSFWTSDITSCRNNPRFCRFGLQPHQYPLVLAMEDQCWPFASATKSQDATPLPSCGQHGHLHGLLHLRQLARARACEAPCRSFRQPFAQYRSGELPERLKRRVISCSINCTNLNLFYFNPPRIKIAIPNGTQAKAPLLAPRPRSRHGF